MAKMEYTGQCLCGGKILTTFKKPDRFQHSVARASCNGCGSDFMFSFFVEYKNGQRAYVPEHEVTQMTEKLRKAFAAKVAESKTKEVSA